MAGDDTTDSDDSTRILRRAPLSNGPHGYPHDGPQPVQPAQTDPEPRTSLIRRHPTGELPAASEPRTHAIAVPQPSAGNARAKPIAVGPQRAPMVDARPAIVATVASILSGWATAVIATDLIAGWWATDPLFCVAVGFLTTICAAATISGVIALLLRRRSGRLLVVVGSVIALLIFASLFVAGAALPALVYVLPALPLTSIVTAALPGTARWTSS